MEEELQELAEKKPIDGKKRFAERILDIALKQLVISTEYKKQRMARLSLYEEFYAGKVARKFRQLFNAPIPIFSGMVDTLLVDFNDPINLRFQEQDPSDYFKIKKIQAAWDKERLSVRPSGKWNLKTRWDRFNALISGRGILKEFASSDDGYENHLNVVDYNFFHCQPTGGGHLENHLFAGEEGILKTKAQLKSLAKAGVYDNEQVNGMLRKIGSKDYIEQSSDDMQNKLSRFRAMGMDTESNEYVGETTFMVCEWALTYGGRRWYLVFEPYTKTWLRFEELKEVYSGEYFPWSSWATHENSRVFWSKSYADDFYPIADAVITLLNQELTNREKKNFNARAYDPDIFTNEQKLDEAQYRPDTLVPADTKGGARRISEGIYEFTTPEISGTINVLDWLNQNIARITGANELLIGGKQPTSKRAAVVFQEQQQLAKRIGYKALSYQEVMGEIGLKFIQGLKDHMGAKMAIRFTGGDGYDHWEEITSLDLSLTKDPSVEIVSTTEQQNLDRLQEEGKTRSLELLADSPNLNSKTRDEFILRKIGKWSDMEIRLMMDTSNYGDKESQAKAAIAIKQLLAKKEPEMNYNADSLFLKFILDFEKDHRVQLEKDGLSVSFMDYHDKHVQIAAENMARKAATIRRERNLASFSLPQSNESGLPDTAQPIPVRPRRAVPAGVENPA